MRCFVGLFRLIFYFSVVMVFTSCVTSLSETFSCIVRVIVVVVAAVIVVVMVSGGGSNDHCQWWW